MTLIELIWGVCILSAGFACGIVWHDHHLPGATWMVMPLAVSLPVLAVGGLSWFQARLEAGHSARNATLRNTLQVLILLTWPLATVCFLCRLSAATIWVIAPAVALGVPIALLVLAARAFRLARAGISRM